MHLKNNSELPGIFGLFCSLCALPPNLAPPSQTKGAPSTTGAPEFSRLLFSTWLRPCVQTPRQGAGLQCIPIRVYRHLRILEINLATFILFPGQYKHGAKTIFKNFEFLGGTYWRFCQPLSNTQKMASF